MLQSAEPVGCWRHYPWTVQCLLLGGIIRSKQPNQLEARAAGSELSQGTDEIVLFAKLTGRQKNAYQIVLID